MPADIHLVHSRPPILDVPPLVWIEPPGAPRAQIPSGPLWEWPAPPPRRRRHVAVRALWLWRRGHAAVSSQIALAVVAAVILGAIAFAVGAGSSPSRQQLAVPVPGHPVWCACVWWPSAPARTG